MERSKSNAEVCVLAQLRFESHQLTAFNVGGGVLISARQIAIAFDYARPDALSDKVATDWSDELTEGIDYVVLRGDQLAAVKAAAPDLVDPRAPSLMLLTESGVHLVALLSRQPAAKRLRRWLAEEVLPQLRRTGSYTLAERPTPERPKLLPQLGKLTAKDVRRLSLFSDPEQIALTVYPTNDPPDPALIDAAVRRPHALEDLLTGLVLRLLRFQEPAQAEMMVAELARILGRPLPEVAESVEAAGLSAAIPFVRARVMLDGAPAHLVLHALVTLNAIYSALKGPWVGHREETTRIANEMFELHQRVAYKMPLWTKELDYTVTELTDAMKAHPNHARLLAMVVRDIAERTPERWRELFLQEQRRAAPRRLTVKKEVA